MPTSIADIADVKLLKFLWHGEVRPGLQSMTLNNFNLCPDPLHYAAYDWGLETLVNGLARDLKLGQYTPQRAELVRGAKNKGLSRPLCFLSTRDALVYKAITWSARTGLTSDAEKWVGFHNSKEGDADSPLVDDNGDSFDWFRFWLARQGSLLEMVDDDTVEYFVESDVANFYASIRLDAIREHLHARAGLEKEVVRLCVQLIDGVMPRNDYSESSLMGLPQEQLDSSQPIAHSLLAHVDAEFRPEGEMGRYMRYMDDILMTVPTVSDGQVAIARLQRSLETIGLYPNPSKTQILTKDQYLHEFMVDSQAEIDRISSDLEKQTPRRAPYNKWTTEEQWESVRSSSDRHRLMDPRPRRWSRVTGRFYTVHREIGMDDWWCYWFEDIENDPGTAPKILEFVRSWPLTINTLYDLLELSKRYGMLYADISILAAEVIATCPNAYDEDLWAEVSRLCRDEFSRLASLSPGDLSSERMAAAWLIASWKFSDWDSRQALIDALPADLSSVSPIRAHALPLVAAQGVVPITEWIAVRPGLDWETTLTAEYLRSLEGGEKEAILSALKLTRARLQLAPQRFTVLPRSIPLLDILGRVAPNDLAELAPKTLRALRKNLARLRDERLEVLVERWRP
ncbi:RNA-directed DNA polymerase [Actinomycetospora lutea]|uniref:RNA-directed DNA polymerase n=1 Tax=Actinomycetospora lutea TaxID=663604 RepID=UPI002366A82E|nr:RNA-directed DNA polymerase [Actinomycetospora lutea]MDD7936978.1 RNA-directed DNA polymerase [Actinomycetospora lutea]